MQGEEITVGVGGCQLGLEVAGQFGDHRFAQAELGVFMGAVNEYL
jgi:hypothetical protein